MVHKTRLENPHVQRRYDSARRGSELTAEVRLCRLGVFCKRLRLISLISYGIKI